VNENVGLLKNFRSVCSGSVIYTLDKFFFAFCLVFRIFYLFFARIFRRFARIFHRVFARIWEGP